MFEIVSDANILAMFLITWIMLTLGLGGICVGLWYVVKWLVNEITEPY